MHLEDSWILVIAINETTNLYWRGEEEEAKKVGRGPRDRPLAGLAVKNKSDTIILSTITSFVEFLYKNYHTVHFSTKTYTKFEDKLVGTKHALRTFNNQSEEVAFKAYANVTDRYTHTHTHTREKLLWNWLRLGSASLIDQWNLALLFYIRTTSSNNDTSARLNYFEFIFILLFDSDNGTLRLYLERNQRWNVRSEIVEVSYNSW